MGFLEALARLWPLLFFVTQAVMAWALWSLKKQFVSRDEYERDTEKRDQRLCELEKGSYSAPSREEIRALSEQIGTLTEKLATIDGRLTGINRAVDLLNQHHLRTRE